MISTASKSAALPRGKHERDSFTMRPPARSNAISRLA
jgi:hypothetical protein